MTYWIPKNTMHASYKINNSPNI